MKGKDEIQNLFSEKLGGYEAKVNPELWGNIASQIGVGTTAATTGMALTTKIIIGLSAASVITVASFVVLTSNKEETPKNSFGQTKAIEIPIAKVTPEKGFVVEPMVSDVIETATVQVEPNVEAQVAQGPVLALIPAQSIPAEQRVLMQVDPDHNVFVAQIELDTAKIVELIIETDPVIIATPKEEIITKESTVIKVVFPNVFTPNNDGTNDLLFISNPEELDRNGFVLQIVDDAFKTVYTSTDPNFEWNGNDLGGEPAKKGHYIAIITSKDKNGNEAKPVMYQFEIRK